ncbi:hypothetical protein T439DRAFT_360688 [Meredithblackwellia eburnea MCA 4105]
MTIQFTQQQQKDQQAPRGGTGSQVLPVADLDDDFDADPNDGEQYLFLVRREAQRTPNFTKAKVNPYQIMEEQEQDEDEEVEQEDENEEEEDPRKPTLLWRKSFLDNFRLLRTRMSKPHSPATTKIDQDLLPATPAPNDEGQWFVFVNGKQSTTTGNKGSSSTSTSIPAAAALALLDSPPSSSSLSSLPPAPPPPPPHPPHPPTPVLILSLDQQTLILILEHITSWLETRVEVFEDRRERERWARVKSTSMVPRGVKVRGSKRGGGRPSSSSVGGVDKNKAKEKEEEERSLNPEPPLPTRAELAWTLSILSRLPSLLSSNDISVLRTLCRGMDGLVREWERWFQLEPVERGEEEEGKEKVGMCWMVKAVVVEVWGQGDLW